MVSSTFAVIPASAAPARGDDAGTLSTIGTWQTALFGPVVGPILSDQECTAIPGGAAFGTVNAFDFAVLGKRVVVFNSDPSNPVCDDTTLSGVIGPVPTPVTGNFYTSN